MLRAPVLMRMRNIREEGRNAGQTIRRKLSRHVRSEQKDSVCNKDLKFTVSDAIYRPALSCCSRFRREGDSVSDLHVNIRITQGM